MTAPHWVRLRPIVAHLDVLDGQLEQWTVELGQAPTPFADAVALVQTSPGVAAAAASAIVAQSGADMSGFPSAAHRASWAGLCPGKRQSGGQRPSRAHHARQSLATGHVGPSGLGRGPYAGPLSGGALSPPRAATRQTASHRGGRPSPLGQQLSQAAHPAALPRPGTRPLGSARPRTATAPLRPSPGAARLCGHPLPSRGRLSRLPGRIFGGIKPSRTCACRKVQQKIAGSFRADTGSEAFPRIRGYLSSMREQGVGLLAALQSVFRGQPLYPAWD
jgi:hypothetical protein